MVGLPVAVFLHNRFSGSSLSFLFFFPLPTVFFVPSATFSPDCGWPQQVLTARSSTASSALPISPYVGTYTPPRARSARGGLYLNNIHELRYTRQIYCPSTRGFCEDLRTDPSTPSPCVPPFFVPWSSHFASFVSLVFEIILRLLIRDFALLLDKNNLTATETVNRHNLVKKGYDSER